MSLKNIQLINAEEVSDLFQTNSDKSSFIRVLSGDKQIDLASARSSTNAIVQGEQLEIKIGTEYTIKLNEYQQDIIVELRDLGWGLLLFINEDPHYLRVNTNSKESEFEAIKNYPSLKIVDFGSGKNEAIKNLDCLVGLKQLHTLNLKSCSSLTSLEGISGLTNLTSLNLNSYSSLTSLEVISGLTNLTSLYLGWCKSLTSLEGISDLLNLTSLDLGWCKSLTSLEGISGLTNLTSLNLSWSNSSLTSLEVISGLTNLTSLDLYSCSSLTSLEGISDLTNLTSLNLESCSSLTSLEGISGLTNLASLNLNSCSSLTSLEGISGLTNLASLNLNNCRSLTSLEGISDLTNLTSLNLNNCSSLTSLEGVSGLTNLTSLDLGWFSCLSSLEGISDLTNLTSLNLYSCESLSSLEGISGLTNLTSLNLSWCYSLTSLEGISSLTNLTSLNLERCKSLTSLEGISGLTNLTSLDLSYCQSLTSLEGISDLLNLTSLDLGWCKSLTSLEGISGLTNLASLNLNNCRSLTSLEGISDLTNLTSLNLNNCSSLTSLEGISCLTNLTSLNLERCKSLTSLEVISGLTNLTSLDLSYCQSLIFIKKINSLTKLTKLELNDCGNIRDFEDLIHCPNLKEVTWIHKASCSYVLTGSAVRRGDRTFIEENIKKWIKDLQFSKDPIPFTKELIDAVGLMKNETIVKENYLALAKVMRERGLADGETGNTLTVHIWELWVEGVMNNESFFQEILSETLVDINYERELEVVVSPIISSLADISVRYPSAKEWGLLFVKEQLKFLVENEDWARTIAPVAAVFYAGMNVSEEVLFWLNKGTHPHIPKWKDTILLALVNYFAPKNQFSEARKYQQQISLPDVQDQARVALVKAMSASLPKEALDEFSNINDFILQTSLAKQLALEPSILASSEGLYQILLCLEQTPALFSEFVSNVLEKQPSSHFVQSIETLFEQPSETSSSATAFMALCNEPSVVDLIGKINVNNLKKELNVKSNEERFPLVSDFITLLIEKKYIGEEYRNELQNELTKNV